MLIILAAIGYLLIGGVVGKLWFSHQAKINAKHIGETKEVWVDDGGYREYKKVVDVYEHAMEDKKISAFFLGLFWLVVGVVRGSAWVIGKSVKLIFSSKPHQRNLALAREIKRLTEELNDLPFSKTTNNRREELSKQIEELKAS